MDITGKPRLGSESAPPRGKLAAAGLAVGLVAAVSGCAGQDETVGSDLTTIVIDYGGSANTAQLRLGMDRGIFEQHGIEIEQVPGSGASSNSVALLLNGQIQMAVSEITAIPAAVEAGFPVEVVTSLSVDYESPEGDAFSIVVAEDSDIESFGDLEGATVAVNGTESFFDLTLNEAVRQEGGDPESIEVLAVPFEDQIAALRQGRVDAVSTIEPFAGQLTSEGFRSLGNPAAAALGPHSVAAVLMASQQYVDENPEVMERFMRAWGEATEYANDHPDEIRATIVETTGASAESVEELPLPWYISGVDRRSAELITDLMVEQGRLETAPELDEFIWSDAPEATDLTTPPSGLEISD